MRLLVLLFLALILSLGSTSCTPDDSADTQTEQGDVFAGDPTSDESGEEEEIDPNN